MNDGSAPRPGLLRSLSVRTKLLAVFLIFFLCALAPPAGTWFLLRQQMQEPPPSPTENVSRQTRMRPPAPAQTRLSARRNARAPAEQSNAAAYRRQMETVLRFSGVAVIALFGIGGLFLYVLWQHVAAPLSRLRREAVAVAGGAPGHRLTIPERRDEIGMLARALRRMQRLLALSPQTDESFSPSGPSLSPASLSDRPEIEAGPVMAEQGRLQASSKGSEGTSTSRGTGPLDEQPDAVGLRATQQEPSFEASPLNEEERAPESGVRYDEFMAIVHPQDREQLRNRQEQAVEEGIPIDLEYRIVSPDGDERIMQERGTVHVGSDGSPPRFSGHVLDVTEQKANEETISRLRQDYDDLLHALPDALLVIKDSSLEILEANDAAASLFGLPEEDLIGQSLSCFYPPDTADKFETLFAEARRPPDFVPYTTRRFADDTAIYVRPDTGDEVPVCLSVAPVHRDGQDFFVVVLRDVTEQQEIQRRLRTFEQAVAQSGDMALITDPEGVIHYANPAAETITGYDRTELVGRTPRFLQSENASGELRKQLWETLNRGEVFRGTFTDERKDGTVVEIDQTITPIYDSSGELRHYVSTGRDVTTRVEREKRLRARRQKIESLYAATSRLLAVEDPEVVFDRVHAVVQDVLDYPVIATGLVEEERIHFANTTVTPDGLPSPPPPASVTSDRVSARALRNGEPVAVEGKGLPAWTEGDGISLASVACVPIGQHGVTLLGQTEHTDFNSFDLRLVAVLGIYAALVLDRLEREQKLRAAKEKAEEAAELKSVMLANMSHEIRTPLTAINGFSEILTEELEAPHDNLAERVYTSGQRLMNTFDSFLQLSELEAGTRELDREKEALDRIVKNTVEEWEGLADDESIALKVHVPEAPVEGRWDADFVGLVTTNLLENALKFTSEEGTVHVRVREDDSHAVLQVEDTGIGIDEDFQPDMFRAFKQESQGLSREYEGAGLGLAITEQAVNCMGGDIEVETEKGEGSRFTIRLPKKG